MAGGGASERGWGPDVLGAGFECLVFDLGPDREVHADEHAPASAAAATGTASPAAHPDLVATLVRSLPEPLGAWRALTGREREFEAVDVLYVHGWSDYFFQRSLAAFWTERGARFFALDLRRYGRSLLDGQTPGYIERLDEYDTEIELALDEIRSSAPAQRAGRPRKLLLFGHSTGGLVLSLWCSRNPDGADGLLLNSPWLEFQLSAIGRQAIAPLVNLGARYSPLERAPQVDYGYYSRAQAEVGPKEDLTGVNEVWRPERTHAVTSGWLSAILAGHARVQAGLGIGIPVCVLLSRLSAMPTKWSEELTRADSVLEVDEIARAALRLGSSVTVERIDGALHDVFLSAEQPRTEAYRRMEHWVVGWLAAFAPGAR